MRRNKIGVVAIAAARLPLATDETLIAAYDVDFARCDCLPAYEHVGVSALPVARCGEHQRGRRCLMCGTRWEGDNETSGLRARMRR